MPRTIDNRRPITFEHFYRCIEPDTTIYHYDVEAQKYGLDPWRIIDDWDVCRFEIGWFDGEKRRDWHEVVWLQVTEEEKK